jgi:hypothetical protein
MRKIDIVSVLLSLMLAMTAGHAAKAEEGEVTLFPTGTGFAEVTAGDSVTYNFDFTNGTDAPITTVAASTLGNGIKFDLGNQNLAVVDDKIVNDKCDVPKLGAGGSCTFGLEVLTKDLNPGGGGGNRADWFVTVGGIYFQPDFELVTGRVTTRVFAPSATPEPATWVLMIAGAMMLFVVRRKFQTA